MEDKDAPEYFGFLMEHAGQIMVDNNPDNYNYDGYGVAVENDGNEYEGDE